MIRKLGLLLLALCMINITGCQKGEESPEEDDTTVINEDGTVTLKYKKPANPTDLLSKLYDQLDSSHKITNSVYEPRYAAAYFAVDFFTWSNKSEREDIGGINMVLPAVREDFASYALRDYYVNFTELYKQHGQKHLPEVINYTIVSMTDSLFTYDHDDYRDLEYKDVTIQLTYKEEDDYDVEDLENEVVVTVVKVDSMWYVVSVNYNQNKYPLVQEEVEEEEN